jgi:hypothetical protein
MATKGKLE